MMLLQEIANRLQLHSHRLPGGIELDQRPAVAPPGDHDEHRGHRAHPAAREDERPREHDAEVAKQERVERQEPDGERRSEEHTSELQSQSNLVCRLLLEKKKKTKKTRQV